MDILPEADVGQKRCFVCYIKWGERWYQRYHSNDVQTRAMAGYGPKFFTSHSFRAGYANRKAAEVLASGGTWQDVLDHLSDGHTWSISSKAVHSYLNPNRKKNFGAGYRYTLEQFELLCSTEIHDLHSIQEPTKRPLTWFHHSPSRLRLLCARVGCEFVENQTKCRGFIGQRLLSC